MVTTTVRICQADACANALEGRQRKFCSHKCSARESYRRRTGLTTFVDKYAGLDTTDKFLRRGDLYHILDGHPLAEAVMDGTMTIGAAADAIGEDRSAMTRTLAALVVDRRNADGLIPQLNAEMVRRFMGPADTELPDADSDEFAAFVDELVDAFVAFRDEFFEVKKGQPFVNKPYHVEWIRLTLVAIFTGGQQLILSPPRHGKSELMVHFCVWLIVRNPDIRIMWVGRSSDMSRIALGAVKDHLEYNEKLITAFRGHEGSYKRKGKWGADEFTVINRTVVGQKAYTMVGVGWTGTILSRDCDFIVFDDIEDDRTVQTQGNRQNTRHKFVTTLDSRNEAHTAVLGIGSRQHFDDLYSYLLTNPEWAHQVNQAHDDDCDEAEGDLPAHYNCMLWPEKHTYQWWFSKKVANTSMGTLDTFEMVYQNVARPSGQVTFDRAAMKACRNYSRRLGDLGWFAENNIANYNLIAGLDPAATGHQAAWLWLYDFDGVKLYMLDADNPEGGGVEQFLDIMALWRTRYQLTHWMVESNNIQRIFINDTRVRNYSGRNGIAIEPAQSGSNVASRQFGVPAMAHWYPDGLVDLPYGDEPAKVLTDAYIDQAVNFDPDVAGYQRRIRDMLMASWFPMPTLQAWLLSRPSARQVTYTDYDPSYPDYEPLTSEEMPW